LDDDEFVLYIFHLAASVSSIHTSKTKAQFISKSSTQSYTVLVVTIFTRESIDPVKLNQLFKELIQ
jgi:predicted RNA methylase